MEDNYHELTHENGHEAHAEIVVRKSGFLQPIKVWQVRRLMIQLLVDYVVLKIVNFASTLISSNVEIKLVIPEMSEDNFDKILIKRRAENTLRFVDTTQELFAGVIYYVCVMCFWEGSRFQCFPLGTFMIGRTFQRKLLVMRATHSNSSIGRFSVLALVQFSRDESRWVSMSLDQVLKITGKNYAKEFRFTGLGINDPTRAYSWLPRSINWRRPFSLDSFFHRAASAYLTTTLPIALEYNFSHVVAMKQEWAVARVRNDLKLEPN